MGVGGDCIFAYAKFSIWFGFVSWNNFFSLYSLDIHFGFVSQCDIVPGGFDGVILPSQLSRGPRTAGVGVTELLNSRVASRRAMVAEMSPAEVWELTLHHTYNWT